MVCRNWLGRMLSREVGLAALLIGASAALAGGPSPDGPSPAERRARQPIVAPESSPGLGEIASASPLLTVYNARGAAGEGARSVTPFPGLGIDFALVAAIAPAAVTTEPTPFKRRGEDATEPVVEVATPAPPPIDVESPQVVPAPTDGALLLPLPVAIELAIERLNLNNDAVNPLGAGDWRNARAAIGAFYAAREYEPVWLDENGLTRAGRSALSQLWRAAEDGLDLSAFALPRDVDAKLPATTLAGIETTIAAAIVAYAEQATGSRVAPSRVSRLIAVSPTVADPAFALAETAAASDPAARLADFNPPQKGYRDLHEELKRLLEADPGDAGLPAIAPAPGLGVGAAAAPVVRATFHPSAHAQSLINSPRRFPPDTVSSFGPSTRRRAAILANMEMWRWEPRNMGERRIEINVADFSVSLLDGDTLLHRARAIVGKPDTPTPIFSNVMRYVLINPSWQVPDSIVRKEMAPKLASDPDYLTRHGYETKMIGGRISVRQPPGDDNALGRIAFMFPNEHSVYLHDTPSRELFSAESRAFSHGCVRVDEALRLAELVLGGAPNGWPARRIDAAIGGSERTVFLPRPLPVHIVYFTEFINEFGELSERPDVYGLTQKVAVILSSDRHD